MQLMIKVRVFSIIQFFNLHLIEFFSLYWVFIIIFIICVIRSQVCGIFWIIFGSFYKVLVHNSHKSFIIIESKFVEERLADLIDVADDDTREENLLEWHHGVQGGLDCGLEKLAGVVVKEKSTRDDGSKDYDGPEDAPVDVGVGRELRWMLSLTTVTLSSTDWAILLAIVSDGRVVWLREVSEGVVQHVAVTLAPPGLGLLPGGEVVPAVQDGLLAEGGEALPVGGNPRLHQPLSGAGQTGGVLHILRGNYFAPDILPFIFNKVL